MNILLYINQFRCIPLLLRIRKSLKDYLENLVDIPFTKYTTKEIREQEKDERLGQSLSAIDRMIYANQPGEKEYFINLKAYSEDQFYKKLEKLKNG